MESLGIYMAVPLIWVKTMGAVHWYRYHPRHEVIYYAGEGAKPTGPTSRWFGPNNETTVWEVPHETSNQNRLHPTQKPVALVERAFHNSTRPGDIVCDPFVGSGTTIIAAEEGGRLLRYGDNAQDLRRGHRQVGGFHGRPGGTRPGTGDGLCLTGSPGLDR